MWIALCLLLGATLGLLAVPLELSFACASDRATRLRLRWLFGLVRVPLPAPDVGAPSDPQRHPARRRRRRWKPGRLLRPRTLLSPVASLLRRLLGCVRVRSLRLRLRLGLDDPADTGLLCAWVLPLRLALPAAVAEAIRFEPDFAAERFEYAGRGRIGFVPLRVIGVLLLFGLGLLRQLARQSARAR